MEGGGGEAEYLTEESPHPQHLLFSSKLVTAHVRHAFKCEDCQCPVWFTTAQFIRGSNITCVLVPQHGSKTASQQNAPHREQSKTDQSTVSASCSFTFWQKFESRQIHWICHSPARPPLWDVCPAIGTSYTWPDMNILHQCMPADSALENINFELNLSFIILSNTWETGKFLTAWIGYSLTTLNHEKNKCL